jgi:hypothetical protein
MKSHLKHLISSVIILQSSEGRAGERLLLLNGLPTLTAGVRIEQTHFRLSRTQMAKKKKKYS